jgi:hemoglobin-like flavoprotein
VLAGPDANGLPAPRGLATFGPSITLKEISMTPSDITLVQDSFAKVAPSAATVATLFYGRLFEQNPGLRTLFKSDLAEQGGKLMVMLGAVVKGLDDLPALVPVAQNLAKRHVAYGVAPEHYGEVGTALLWTLSQGLGPGFTPEVEAAWRKAYGTLSTVMVEAAYPSTADN